MTGRGVWAAGNRPLWLGSDVCTGGLPGAAFGSARSGDAVAGGNVELSPQALFNYLHFHSACAECIVRGLVDCSRVSASSLTGAGPITVATGRSFVEDAHPVREVAFDFRSALSGVCWTRHAKAALRFSAVARTADNRRTDREDGNR
jgi:hypothetical protein